MSKVKEYLGIIQDSVSVFGEGNRIDTTQEKCSNLIDALSNLNKDDIKSIRKIHNAIADVQVMLDTMMIIFDNNKISRSIKNKVKKIEESIIQTRRDKLMKTIGANVGKNLIYFN